MNTRLVQLINVVSEILALTDHIWLTFDVTQPSAVCRHDAHFCQAPPKWPPLRGTAGPAPAMYAAGLRVGGAARFRAPALHSQASHSAWHIAWYARKGQ